MLAIVSWNFDRQQLDKDFGTQKVNLRLRISVIFIMVNRASALDSLCDHTFPEYTPGPQVTADRSWLIVHVTKMIQRRLSLFTLVSHR